MADMDLAGAGNVAQDIALNKESNGMETAQNAAPKPQEQMIPQSEVNRIVARTREQTREHYYNQGKQDALADNNKRESESSQSQTQSMGGMLQLTPEQLEKLMDEKLESKIKERDEIATGQRIAQSILTKWDKGRSQYSDFDDVVSKLNLPTLPHIAEWLNNLENTEDVMYELGKSSSKFSNILVLSHTSPEFAMSELKKLSSSIKTNKDETAKSNKVREPLGQIRPSPTGTDNGSQTIRDLRKQPWLRA